MTERTEEDSKIDKECATHLVELIINQDHIAQNFLKFMLSVEAALVLAFAFFLRPVKSLNETVVSLPLSLAPIAMWLIPAMGILVAILLIWVVVYERRWQTLYVQKFNELPQREGRVFPMNHRVGSPVAKMPLGDVDWAVTVLGIVTVIGWLVILYFSFD